MTFAAKLLTYLSTLGFLNGYRMYFGGIGFVLIGLGQVAQSLGGDSNVNLIIALGAIAYGVKTIGEAGKQDKQIAATNANTVVVASADPKINTVTAKDAKDVIASLPAPTLSENKADEPVSAAAYGGKL